MATTRDYYEILGYLKSTPRYKEIYQLALKYHPDRNKEPGAEESSKRSQKLMLCFQIQETGSVRPFRTCRNNGQYTAEVSSGVRISAASGILKCFSAEQKGPRGPRRGSDSSMTFI